jgi:hypothetical protein
MNPANKREASAFGRPRSAPIGQDSPDETSQAALHRRESILADLEFISKASAQQLIASAQRTVEKINGMHRKTIMLPRLSPLPAKVSAIVSAANESSGGPSITLNHCMPNPVVQVAQVAADSIAVFSDSKSPSPCKKLRPFSAVMTARSAANRPSSLRPTAATSAQTIIRFFVSSSSAAAQNAQAKLSDKNIMARWKRACASVTRNTGEVVTLLQPVIYHSIQNLDRLQAPEIALGAAIIVRCSEVSANMQELQDMFHNSTTQLRKMSSDFRCSDIYANKSRIMLFEIQTLFESFSLAQSHCLAEQQSVKELHEALSAVMDLEVRNSNSSFETAAVCSASVHAVDELAARLLNLHQETNAMFSVASSSFISSFLETCSSFESIAETTSRSVQRKSMVPLPLSPDEDRVFLRIESFLESCKYFQKDLSKFLFISDKVSIESNFLRAQASCAEFSKLYKNYIVVVETHKKIVALQKSFQESLQNHQFSDATVFLTQIEQNCSLISDQASSDLVSRCQLMFASVQSDYEKNIVQVREQIHLAQKHFARDDLQTVYSHIHSAKTSLSNIKCTVPESATLNSLFTKVKSVEARRFWHAKSSVQLSLSSISESLAKLREDSVKGSPLLEQLSKLGAAMDTLRGIIDKFSIADDAITNQVQTLQGNIDDLNVLASGARLESLEIIHSNCLEDFQKLLEESDELYKLEHGIPILKQIQYRLKRCHNSSLDDTTKEGLAEFNERCAQEISRIELLRVKHLEQSKIELAELKYLLTRASAQDDSEVIPQLHRRILSVRQVANAVDDQDAIIEMLDLCRKSTLLVEHRDNWLSSKVLVYLSEAESVIRNHRSEVRDLIAAIEKLKENDAIVAKVTNSALQVAIISKIERTATDLRRSLILIQNDQREKKEALDSVNYKLKQALALFNDRSDEEASVSIMLELQSRGLYLKPRIHIEAADSFKDFEILSSCVSEIHKRRECLSSTIIEAGTICKTIELWKLQEMPSSVGSMLSNLDFKPLLLPLFTGSRFIVALHMYDKPDTRDLTDRLHSLIFDAVLVAIQRMTEFISNSQRDVSAVENLLAANEFAHAVPIVDLLSDNLVYHQTILLHLKSCFQTMFKFYKIQIAPHLTQIRLTEYDLIKLIQRFDLMAHELPLLRAGVQAQGDSLLKEAHLACLARQAGLAREKLHLAVLLLKKVCEPQRWQAVSENLSLLERRCFAEAAASKSLCKMSQSHCKSHNFNEALIFLLSACKTVDHWNLDKKMVVTSFEFVVSSALEFISGVCIASNEIWDSFEVLRSQGFSFCQGQNLTSALLGVVQHHNLMRDVVYTRMFSEEYLVWDDALQIDKPMRANLWRSPLFQLSPLLIGMTKELMFILEDLQERDDCIWQSSETLLSAMSSSIRASLHDSNFLFSARCKISDDIRERRLADGYSDARDTIIRIVAAGVSPDYIMSLYAEYDSLRDCMQQLESCEPAFSVPYQATSLPHVLWLPPKTVKLDVETTSIVTVDISVELKACLDVCCCALAEKDIETLECEIICSQNRSNIGFLNAAAALAPGAFFEVLLVRHSCELDMFETLDGHTLLHFASCYCNDQSLKVILERLNDPKLLFKPDSFGRNALHFVFGANRESLGVTETSLFSIFDSTYAKWVSLQECISKFSPESRGLFTMGGFLLLSRHTPRHVQSHLNLEIVLKILLRDMSQVLEPLAVPDYAMNNVMHYIARRSFRAHTAPQPESRNTRSRRTGVLRTLHSDCALVQDKFIDLVIDQEIERRDLKSLYKIFQVFQKTSLLTLVNDENLDGMTPLLLACSHGNSTVVALFILQLGADTSCSDTLKRTPLHFAAECNDTHSFQLLLKCPGTDILAVDHRRQTALFRLASLGFESLFAEMAALLQTSGATQVK